MPDSQFRQVSIIGLGLIGGSLAAGIKDQQLADSVVAFDTDAQSLDDGRSLVLIDRDAESIEDAVADADLVILAVPVRSIPTTLYALGEYRGLITDVGSVKSTVIDAARKIYGEVPANLVPGHPIAGSEKHGVTAADPDLFRGRRVILTPVKETDATALASIRAFWQALGAEVVEMDPAHHDSILAQTSHLPHLLAYALVDTLSGRGDSLEIFQYAAGGFRDFSRIAASDPVMWRDIFTANGEAVVEVLDRYLGELQDLRQMIESGDSHGLEQVFHRAKAARDHFSTLDASKQEKPGD